ncbi:hypothetical protein J3F84DRAFT_386921, partial [Trichoderma pleuroticola]
MICLKVVSGQDKWLPAELDGRFTFMAQSLFDEQKIQEDVYLLRYILRNWPVDYCVLTLRVLIPIPALNLGHAFSDHAFLGLPEGRDFAIDFRMMILHKPVNEK